MDRMVEFGERLLAYFGLQGTFKRYGFQYVALLESCTISYYQNNGMMSVSIYSNHTEADGPEFYCSSIKLDVGDELRLPPKLEFRDWLKKHTDDVVGHSRLSLTALKDIPGCFDGGDFDITVPLTISGIDADTPIFYDANNWESCFSIPSGSSLLGIFGNLVEYVRDSPAQRLVEKYHYTVSVENMRRFLG